MKFLIDTSSLMHHLSDIPFNQAIISSVVLRELDKHKNSSDAEKSFLARQAIQVIRKHADEIEFDPCQYPRFKYLSEEEYDQDYSDNRLLESLFHHKDAGREVGLITSDFNLELQARASGFKVINPSVKEEKTHYQGTKAIPHNDQRLPYFFRMLSNPKHDNIFNCLIGEYIIILKEKNFPFSEIEPASGAWKWTGVRYQPISMNQTFNNSIFPETKPRNYRQAIAMDSLRNNPVTVLTGKAGCGKTYLGITYILQQIEHFDRRAFLVTNNVPLRGTRTFGYKKGDINTKILQSNLGKILISKIGVHYTEYLVKNEKIVFVAIEDIRGTSYNDIVYVTEAQNYSVDMVKVLMERMENEEGQIIFDGDLRQIDTGIARGANTGIIRLLDTYKGSGYLGHVELLENLRGGVSKLADKM